MHGRNLSCCLKYESVSFAACDRHCFFHVAFFFCIDDFVCTETFCKVKTFITDVEYDYFLGTEDLGPLHGEHSYSTAAEDCYVFAAVIVVLEYTVDRYGCRLEHCALFVGNALVKWNCILLWNYYVVCVASLLSGTDEAVVFAEREVSLLAVVAFHAWEEWCAGYAVAYFNLGYAFADFYYVAGEFVAEDYRIKMNTVVQYSRDVGAADAGVSDADLHCAFGYLWFFNFLILYVFVCYYYCCFHNVVLLLSSKGRNVPLWPRWAVSEGASASPPRAPPALFPET